MKNGMLGILQKLSKKKDAVQFQWLSGQVTGFKALPADRKRWAKGEQPVDAEICYIGSYEDALNLYRGNESEKVALIVWLSRKEYEAALAAEKEKPC